jgi:hypothetical protein
LSQNLLISILDEERGARVFFIVLSGQLERNEPHKSLSTLFPKKKQSKTNVMVGASGGE